MKKNLTLFLMLIWFLISAETWNYEMQKITIPVGNGENEIYIYDAPDQQDVLDEGPTKFQVDEERNIFILDRKKIKKFDKTGIYLYSTQEIDLIIHSFVVHEKMIWSICGNHRNEVFLRRFSEKCDLIDTHQIENRKSSLAINQDGKVGLNLGNNNFLEFNLADNLLITSDSQLLNDVIFDFNPRQNVHQILLPEENIELDLNEVWFQNSGFIFFDLDKAGNLFFEIFNGPMKDSFLGIISADGEVIKSNVIFSKPGLNLSSGTAKFISLQDEIYQMKPSPDKIEILKWTRTE